MQLAPAYPGAKWVFNRLNLRYVKTFNGIPHEFQPGEYRCISEEAADFLAERSCVKEDPYDPTNNIFAIVREGDPAFGVPVEGPLPVERLDRSSGDYIVKPRGKDDPKTTAQVIPVPGTLPAVEPKDGTPGIKFA